MVRMVSGGPQFFPHDAERQQSLGQLCVWPLKIFSLAGREIVIKQSIRRTTAREARGPNDGIPELEKWFLEA